ERNVNVNAVMSASGTAGLEMNYGGYSATQPAVGAGSGVNMQQTDQGFAGRVDFTGTHQLRINGGNYPLLSQAAVLQSIRGNLSGKYALGATINASAVQNFSPIGDENTPFTGTFEGLGHRIDNLSVNRAGQNFAGLFGVVSNATLRNVGLQDA